jgi:hypothetical protein
VREDAAETYKWLHLSAEQGNESARRNRSSDAPLCRFLKPFGSFGVAERDAVTVSVKHADEELCVC